MLVPWKKSYNKPRQQIKKQRHDFADKDPVKAMAFPVVMYGCESWTIKKAEHRRIDAFELWCWRRLLRVPWTARRSNQSILKEIKPEYSLEWLMLKLKVKYFGNLMWRANSLEKTLTLGKIEGRRRGQQRMRWLNGITDSMDMNLSKRQEMVKDRKGWCAAVYGIAKSRTWLRDWTTITNGFSSCHVWMWELDHKESWVLKNWCFQTEVLEKTLESPLDNKEINHKRNNPEYSLEGLMLKLQCFGHLMRRANSLEKTLILGKIEDRRRREQQRMRWFDGITDSICLQCRRTGFDPWVGKIPWRRTWQPTPVFLLWVGKPGGPQTMGLQRDMTSWLNNSFYWQQIRRMPGIFPKAVFPEQHNWGGLKL